MKTGLAMELAVEVVDGKGAVHDRDVRIAFDATEKVLFRFEREPGIFTDKSFQYKISAMKFSRINLR